MEQNIPWEEMEKLATEAVTRAYVPYSHYPVGACLLGKSGKLYSGCNVENASFGLTNCAERTAVFKAVSEGETEFLAVVVTNGKDDLPYPCGACRQVLSEFCTSDVPIRIFSATGNVIDSTIGEILPFTFLKSQVME